MIRVYAWLDQYKKIGLNDILQYFGIEVEVIAKYETLQVTSNIDQTLSLSTNIDQTLSLSSKMDIEAAS